MSSVPAFPNGSGDSSPLRMYAKTFDHDFALGCGVTLRLRVFRPLWKRSLAPLVLLCWTLREEGSGQAIFLKEMAEPLRRTVMHLPCRVSLIERFVRHTSSDDVTESIHKVLEVLTEQKGGGSVLFAIRRSVLESLTGESLDAPNRRYPA